MIGLVEIALLLVGLAVAVLAGTAAAERLSIPPPLLLIAAGVAGSYLPVMPAFRLEPEVVLVGLLPPLLYAAALQTSLVDFRDNHRPILLLSVGLVVFTTIGVAATVHAVLPGVSWAAALAIGAVVAPPDAVAATAIGRRIGLPRRVVTILEGESLLNDATALVALRTAIAATAMSAGFSGAELGRIGLDFLIAAVGGVVVGLLAYRIVAWLRRSITDPLLDSAISLVTPFAAFVAAEQIHASGVLAVVVAGLLLGHHAPVLQTAQSRIAERLNWRTIAYVLENTVFLLIGLQARAILDDVGASDVAPGRIATVCLATLLAVIVLRLGWVVLNRALLVRPGVGGSRDGALPWSSTLVVGWAGMRGVVTLAAAFVLPSGVEDREVLLLAAFTVVAGTLFLQALTLPWLARLLRVPGPDPSEDALARASLLEQASQAGLPLLEELERDDRHGTAQVIRDRIEQRNFAAWERLATAGDQISPSDVYSRTRRAMIEAERARVLQIRATGRVSSQVVSEVLGMLDIEESMLEFALQERQVAEGTAMDRQRMAGDSCEDMASYPPVETAADPACDLCAEQGVTWVAMRQCLVCGELGCCDSSPLRHASEHFRETGHPVAESAEPGEDWRWCFVHRVTA